MTSLIIYLVESGICLGLFYFIYRIFLSRETFFRTNRLYLLFAIPLSFAIPLINIPSPFLTAKNPVTPYLSPPGAGAVPHPNSLVDLVWIGYLMGALFFLVCFGYKLSQLWRLVKKYGYQKCGKLKLVYVEEDTAPFSFFNYFFLNKSNISQHDLLRIIDHELVHINQHHSIDLIVIELLTIIQWFNPFVRPYKKSLKETHEYLADNQVIAQGCSRAKYQLLIFEQHVGMNLFEFVNNFNHSLIKRRITMMTKGKSKSWAKSKFLLLIPVICFLVLAFANPKPADSSGYAFVPSASADQDSSDKAKQKDQQQKLTALMQKEKELKELYAKTEDPEKKKMIKGKLAEIQQAKENAGWVEAEPKIISEEEYASETKKIKTLLENTEDPKKQELLKARLRDLQEMKTKGWVKPNGNDNEKTVNEKIDYEKQALILKELLEKEKDPEKAKQIKAKLAKLKELAEKERAGKKVK